MTTRSRPPAVVPELSRLPADALARTRPVLVQAPVVENRKVAPEYWSLRLQARPIVARAQPGQFVMLTLARQDEARPVLPRPMAIYDWDEASGLIEIVYRIVGAGTRILAGWRPGERMTTVGPLGRGFTLRTGSDAVLLLGRGIGTCSLTALAGQAAARGVDVYAVCSGRNREALIGGEYYRRMGAAEVIEVCDSDGSSDPALLRERLAAVLDERPLRQIFVCGSQRLLRLAVELGQIHNAQIQVSVEAHMACGLGYCHGCSTGTAGVPEEAPLVCVEGPVFSAQTAQAPS